MSAAEPLEAPYQSLYRRFRPATFAGVRGQDHVVLALRNAVREGRVAHAYLFSGPRGTGKTSTARILAMALNCTDLRDGEPCGVCPSCVEIARGSSLDVHELDAASNNGVEAMRDLVARAALGTPGRQKVYIVDEVHMLSTAASNALLKTLEEPPPHVVFVLATTDPQKVLPTIRSRTQHFEFRLLGPDVLSDLLDDVRRQAGLEIPDEAVALAVRRGRGSARDALSVLDQVAASDSVDDDLPELGEIVEALAERDVSRALAGVAQLVSAGYSPQQLAADLLDHLRQGFLVLVAPELVSVAGSEREALAAQAERVGLAALVRALEVVGQAQVAMREAPDPRVNLEVALIRLAHPEADVTPDALLVRIERLEAGGGDRPSSSGSSPAPPAPPPAAPSAGAVRRTVGAVRREGATSSGGATEPAPPRTEPPVPVSDRAEAEGPARAGSVPDAAPEDASGSTPVKATGATTPGSVEGNAPDRDQLVQAWGDHIIGRLRPKAKALYQAGRFMAAADGRAEFGLPNEIHRTRCEELRPEVEQALAEHFGHPVVLELVVDPGAEGDPQPPPPDPGSPAAARPARSSAGRTARGRRADPSPGSGHRPDSTGGAEAGGADPGPGSGRSTSSPPALDDAPSGSAPVAGAHDDPTVEDLSAFDESELGEVAAIDNSAQYRVLQAFPGAEEVT